MLAASVSAGRVRRPAAEPDRWDAPLAIPTGAWANGPRPGTAASHLCGWAFGQPVAHDTRGDVRGVGGCTANNGWARVIVTATALSDASGCSFARLHR